MLKKLSAGVKSSITRSITTVFEQYMASIEWSEDKFAMEDFFQMWSAYINESATWMQKIPNEVKFSSTFHEDLAKRINEIIEKILNEPPSEDQIAAIEILQEKLNTDYTYSCKAEAAFIEEKLKQHQA